MIEWDKVHHKVQEDFTEREDSKHSPILQPRPIVLYIHRQLISKIISKLTSKFSFLIDLKQAKDWWRARSVLETEKRMELMTLSGMYLTTAGLPRGFPYQTPGAFLYHLRDMSTEWSLITTIYYGVSRDLIVIFFKRGTSL